MRYARIMAKTARPAREHTAVRLSADALARVATLAEDEMEGNVSAMLRKLLGEALRARETRQGKQ